MTDSTIETIIRDIAIKAQIAAAQLVRLLPQTKNQALMQLADELLLQKDKIKSANALDLAAGKAKGLSDAMLDRLTLTDKGIESMANALRQVASLPDPVGEIYDMKTRPNGLKVGRMRVPFGVIGIIYESRPNVTCDAGALCVKSGNAVILRGGSEAFNSNRVLAEIMNTTLTKAGLPENAVQLIPTTDRAAVNAMLRMKDQISLIIPRGGRSLIEMVMENSLIPVIKHYDGICHVYVDTDADIDTAVNIVINSKCQRTGVCNAMETLLVHQDIAPKFIPVIAAEFEKRGVTVYSDKAFAQYMPTAKPATEENFRTEYLAMTCSAAVVKDLNSAIAHINKYSSHHTESIITKDYASSMRFLAEVDSACCHVNCSTRFSDGGEYGMGCEIGISTDRLHARGPMGLTELTTSKFIVLGNGQVR